MCPTCSGLQITGPPPKLCTCSPVTPRLVVDLWNEVEARREAIPRLRQPLRVAEICEVLSTISDYPGDEGAKAGRWSPFPDVLVRRVGKTAAGRLLDGREWNEVPNV